MSEEKPSFAEYFQAVGKASHNAAAADNILFSAFWRIAGCRVDVARAIYYSIDSMRVRKSLVKRITLVVGDDEDMKLAMQIANMALRASTFRNDVAHVVVMSDTKTPDAENTKPTTIYNAKFLKDPHKDVTKESLGIIVGGTMQATMDAVKAYHRLCEKRGVQPTLGGV